MGKLSSFSAFVLILLILSMYSPARAAENTRSQKRRSIHYWEVTLGYASWPDLDSIMPQPVDFVAEQSGRFDDQAVGIDIAYHRVTNEHGRALFLVGGELAGYGFDNAQGLVGYRYPDNEQITIRMEASWGHVTSSVRWFWGEERGVQFLAGAGAGVYLLRFNDVLDDFDIVDRGESDATPGGYIMIGLRFPVRSGRVGIRSELRMHLFNFDDIGGAFDGQEVSGPLTVFNFGIDF